MTALLEYIDLFVKIVKVIPSGRGRYLEIGGPDNRGLINCN